MAKSAVPPVPPSTNKVLRPNVLTLDFVENGSYCEKILTFFLSLTPSDFDQKYPYARSFRDSGSFAIGLGQGNVMGRSGGWAVPTAIQSQAVQFSMRYCYDKSDERYYTYFILVGGDYNGYFMSLNTNYCIGWYGWNGARGWGLFNGGLFSNYNSQYLSPTSGNNYMYANASPSAAAPVTLVWK